MQHSQHPPPALIRRNFTKQLGSFANNAVSRRDTLRVSFLSDSSYRGRAHMSKNSHITTR